MAKGKKNSEETEKKEEDNEASFLNILFKVDLHCHGCTTKIKKYTLKFPGVCKVEFEGESKVKVLAQKDVDAVKLRDKLQKKMMKRFELVSPQPKKEDKTKQNQENKPKEVQVTAVVLKVQFHCHGCIERIHKAFKSYEGVHEVKLDKEKSTVKVTGRIEVKKMIEDVSKKLHRPIEIVPEKKDKEKKEGKNEGEGENKKDNVKVEYLVNGSGYVGLCDGSGRVLQIFDPPQFFSDDNPVGCCIM